ncbi:MAG: MlaA family lipoprotein [Noviherbaspirillum sp.]
MAVAIGLAGCAATNPKDPFEGFNRAMFDFNDTLDKAAIKPAAEAYTHLPSFVQTGVNNFFGNLGDVWTAANNLLQGKLADGMSDVMRVAVNTTFGLVGLLDIGTEAGLTKHNEDFGQTLGKWGLKSGPYVVLPILGSSTLRDTAATPLDFAGNPLSEVRPVHWRNTGAVLRGIDQRAALLGASTLIEEAALDRYVFIRDAYLQRRQNQVYDGNPPESAYEHDVGPTLTTEGDADLKQKQSADNGVQATGTEPAAKSVVEMEQKSRTSTTSAKQ